MAILPVYTYDHPILTQIAKPVEEITDELKVFVRNLIETMHNADGIGLAANQVGDERAITVIDLSEVDDEKTGKPFPKTPPLVLINPVITQRSGEMTEFEEGCLSLPRFRDKVVRPEQAQVRFFDLTMHEHTLDTEGLLSRVVQHELDHLNGIYFFELLSPMRRAMAHPKLKRIQLGQIDADYPLFNPKEERVKKLVRKRK
jgi:peptide deformylase